MKLPITTEWFEKQVAKEGDADPTTGKPDYIPAFVPSAADRYYGKVIEQHVARVAELQAEIDRLRAERSFVVGCNEGYETAIEHAASIADEAALNAAASKDRKGASSTGGTAVLTGYIFAETEAKAIAAKIRALVVTPAPAESEVGSHD